MHQHCVTSIKNMGVSLSGREVLSGIDLTLRCGELTAVIGRNGAGKTTLLRALMGLIPSSGEIAFRSEKGKALSRPHMGYVPQSLHFDKLSPLRVIDVFAACLGRRPAFFGPTPAVRKQTHASLEYTQAGHLIERQLGELSGGELQRVLLALALTPMPQILLLDEPVSALDRKGLMLFYDLLDTLRARHDISILLVSHDVDIAAQHADRMALLGDRGLLCTGEPQAVLSSMEYARVFGAAAI